MTAQLLTFYIAAALALLGALLALTRARPLPALRWFGLTLAALLVIEHQLVAPLIALLSLLCFAAAAAYLGVVAAHAPPAPVPLTPPAVPLTPPAVPLSSAPSPARTPLRRTARIQQIARIALPLAALLALAWVLTGTWARQHAWPGQELAPNAGFGGLNALTTALGGQHLGVLIALVLLALVAAVGGLALLDLNDPPRR